LSHDDPTTGSVSLEVADGVATITLDFQARRNAISLDMAARLAALCDEVNAEPTIGAAIVTGAGGHFCSGADRAVLAAAGRDPAAADAYRDLGVTYASFQRVGELGVPTIAAVQGAAVGAGVNLMLATDLRIVAEDARIISGFQAIGLHPGGGHFTLLSRTAGREAAAGAALFGEPLTGTEAAAYGLAWKALPSDEVLAYARRLAVRTAADPELARATVASFRAQLGPPAQSWPIALQAERAPQMWSLRRRDHSG
jgi:enoyl-CoA hydratase